MLLTRPASRAILPARALPCRKLPAQRRLDILARRAECLGFIVLAAMLKYLANVDAVLGWHFLTRERVLAAWIVLFALPGIYLLGWLRMEGMSEDEPVAVPRSLIAALLLIFSLSLVPGLFGGRLGELDAFLAESSGSLFGAASGGSAARAALLATTLRQRASPAPMANSCW